MAKDIKEYEDLLGLDPPPAGVHALSAEQHAAQFAPFDALTGYGDVVRETARLTDEQTEIADDEKERLDMLLLALLRRIAETGESAPARVTYFVPDGRKSGGKYVSLDDALVSFDPERRELRMRCGERIPADAVRDMKAL